MIISFFAHSSFSGCALALSETLVPSDAACTSCSPFARFLHLKASFCTKILQIGIFCSTFAAKLKKDETTATSLLYFRPINGR